MFNPAYIIVPHNTRTPKAPYVADQILTPLWHRRKTLRPAVMDTLSSYYVRLSQRRGLGSFMSAQIIADLKYVSPLDTASDWRTFAASGPGSRRGLNRILSKPARNHISEVKWRAELNTLIEKLVPYSKDLPFLLDAQDVQNVLCEFDKYERTRLGEGTPRRKFTGGDL
jgi:hypothetical protein